MTKSFPNAFPIHPAQCELKGVALSLCTRHIVFSAKFIVYIALGPYLALFLSVFHTFLLIFCFYTLSPSQRHQNFQNPRWTHFRNFNSNLPVFWLVTCSSSKFIVFLCFTNSFYTFLFIHMPLKCIQQWVKWFSYFPANLYYFY